MKEKLFRNKKIFLKLKTLDRKTRGFLCDLTIGFQGAIDPESGMILNLKDIDAGLFVVQENLKQKVFASLHDPSIVTQILQLLQGHFSQANLIQVTLKINHENLKWIWQQGQLFQEQTVLTTGADFDGSLIQIEMQIYYALIKSKQTPVGIRVQFFGESPEVFEVGETF